MGENGRFMGDSPLDYMEDITTDEIREYIQLLVEMKELENKLYCMEDKKLTNRSLFGKYIIRFKRDGVLISNSAYGVNKRIPLEELSKIEWYTNTFLESIDKGVYYFRYNYTQK